VRVFVAGATGAIGKPLVRRLAEAGHEVVGMTRREERCAELRECGAEPVVCDARDSAAFRRTVAEARPEVLVHQLTDLPQDFSPRYRYGETNALRTNVTRDLIEAGREAGARRIVAQSVSFFYVPTGDMVKDEEAPIFSSATAPGKFGEAADAMRELERQVVEAEDMEGLVLRYGFFYGPGTWFDRGTRLAKTYERRMSPIVGNGEGRFPLIHVDDAASATVAAVERGAPGVYNVTDDEPAPAREWLSGFAEAVGGKPPRRVPLWVGRLVAGWNATAMETMRGASNAKVKRELGWQPRYPTFREGLREGLS
jgi:nucleoside-diphosphate-sugar epimerase